MTAYEVEEMRHENAHEAVIREWIFATWLPVIAGVDPSLVFNFDEMGIDLTSRKTKVVVPTDDKEGIVATPNRLEHSTLIACIGSTGTTLRPCVVLPRDTPIELPPHIAQNERFMFLYTKSGWNTNTVFEEYVAVLIIDIEKRRTMLGRSGEWAVLLADNHATRFNRRVIRMLDEHRIRLVTIPPHTSHILQPIDLVFAREFKRYFSRFIKKALAEAKKDLTKPAQTQRLIASVRSTVSAYDSACASESPLSSWMRARRLPLDLPGLLASDRISQCISADDSEKVLKSYKSRAASGFGGELVNLRIGSSAGVGRLDDENANPNISDVGRRSDQSSGGSSGDSGQSLILPSRNKRKRRERVLHRHLLADGRAICDIEVFGYKKTRKELAWEEEVSEEALKIYNEMS